MLMKPFSAPKKNSRAAAKNALLLNLLATPGLGSLVARRWVAGIGQLFLALAGFTLLLVGFVKLMIPYYSLGFSFNDLQPRPVNWKAVTSFGVVGAGLFALSWFWSLATGLSLLREAAINKRQSAENFATGQMKLADAQVQGALAALPNWEKRGDVISRTFQFKDFPAAIKFVNAVADLAEEAWHHPDIDVRWNKVTLALTTHDAGGLTEMDFTLAKQFDGLSFR
jgi:4a-hydroxytetrahydrobiopterin dehydratase